MMARLRATSEMRTIEVSRLNFIRVLRWLAGLAEDHQNALMASTVS